MAITFTNGSATIGTTEFFCMSNSTTQVARTNKAIVQPFLDVVANLAAGDQFQVTVYETINGGTQRVVYRVVLTGAQAAAHVFPALVLGEGWEIGLQKLAGTDRAIPFSIRQVA